MFVSHSSVITEIIHNVMDGIFILYDCDTLHNIVWCWNTAMYKSDPFTDRTDTSISLSWNQSWKMYCYMMWILCFVLKMANKISTQYVLISWTEKVNTCIHSPGKLIYTLYKGILSTCLLLHPKLCTLSLFDKWANNLWSGEMMDIVQLGP